MIEVTLQCECGACFIGRSHFSDSAHILANKKRSACRESDPELHDAMRKASRMADRIPPAFDRRAVKTETASI